MKRRREGDEKAADEDAPMGAEQGGADSPRAEPGDEVAVPMEASLVVEGMLEGGKNEEEVERVVLEMNEEAATRDAVNNPRTEVVEARSTLERVQESVYFDAGAELGQESAITAMADEVDAMGKINVGGDASKQTLT